MNHSAKRILTLLTVILLLSLCACGGSDAVKRTLMDLAADDYILLLQGNLDELYLGKFDPDYLEMVDSTEADSQAVYEDSMAYAAEYFCYYFDIEYPTEACLEELIELHKEIYSHAKYTVVDASSMDDTTYVLKVNISPIDIMELMVTELENGTLDAFYDKYPDAKVQAMTEEEYIAYDEEWAGLIVDLLKSQMPNLGHKDEQSLLVQISLDNEVWMLTDADLQNIDSCILAFP